jgi:hypothetical protein
VKSVLLKRDPDTPPGAPDNPATLLDAAKQQFKSIGQLGLSPNLDAGAAGGIVHDPAIDDREFRVNDQFGDIGISACRPNACEPARMHDVRLL